jgi:hypothetical protein
MERLKMMKEKLMHCAETQVNEHLSEVNAEELGEVIDMIKDLEEAMYYKSVTEAMEEGKEKEKHYPPVYYTSPTMMRDMDMNYGRMYYQESPRDMGGRDQRGYMEYAQGGNQGNGGGSRNYTDYNQGGMRNYSSYTNGGSMQYHGDGYPIEIRDYREGQSPISRKNYMESKQTHQPKEVQMKELEKYVQELGKDLTEMVQDATPEEKQILQQKINMLASKIK